MFFRGDNGGKNPTEVPVQSQTRDAVISQGPKFLEYLDMCWIECWIYFWPYIYYENLQPSLHCWVSLTGSEMLLGSYIAQGCRQRTQLYTHLL